MHQGRCLQDGFGAFPPHEPCGEAMKLAINAGCKCVERGCVASGPGKEKLRRFRDLRLRSHGVCKHNKKNYELPYGFGA